MMSLQISATCYFAGYDSVAHSGPTLQLRDFFLKHGAVKVKREKTGCKLSVHFGSVTTLLPCQGQQICP
jgi:hypothetical protein